MGSWIGIIIAAVYVIVTGIVKMQERRKQQEAMRRRQDVARQQQAGSTQPPGPVITRDLGSIQAQIGRASGPGGQAPLTPQAMRSGRRIDDLAARRQAQLEQLRQRKQGLSTARSPAGAAGRPVPSRSSPGSRPTEQTGMLSEQARMRQQIADRQSREQARAIRDQQAHVAHMREVEAQAAHGRAAQQSAEAARQRQAEREQAARAQSIRQALAGQGQPLRHRLKIRAVLREAIIVNEILQPPLALRPSRG